MPTPPGLHPNIFKFTSLFLKTLCPEIEHFEWHRKAQMVYAVQGSVGHELGKASSTNEAKNLICAFRLGYKMASERKLILKAGDNNAGAGTTGLPEPR